MAEMLAEACHVCGQAALDVFPGFAALARVTSDCRPFRSGGRLAVCRACGAVQKVVDAAFAADCDEVYAGYRLYHQGQGGEQRIFDQRSGQSRPRSALVLDHLHAAAPCPAAGRLLDIGCGEGFFLAAFAARFPGWRISGLDMGSRYRERILALPGAEAYYDGDPGQVSGPFDILTLNHTLEHIPHPVDYLARVRGLLRPGGTLLIDVPDWTANPFDFAIADHCTHFTGPVLEAVLGAAGFRVLSASRDVIGKEWLAVAEAKEPQAGNLPPALGDATNARGVASALDWLDRFAQGARQARSRAADAPFGIFGTAIAGVWLDATLRGEAGFFVDEDPGRAGSEFMGRPVLTPGEIPAHAAVHLAFPSAVARRIAARLAGLPVSFVLPPD